MHIGVDIGGTSIKAGLFEAGELLPRAEASSPSPVGGGPQLTNAVVATIEDLGVELGSVCTIGAIVPGIVDTDEGTVRDAINLGIGGEPFPFASALETKLGRRVPIENDVRGATIGAATVLRRSEPAESVLYIGIGTGLAAGLILNDTLFRGSSGLAGEFGHIGFGTSTVACACGNQGCLEAIASGPAIAEVWPHPEPARALFDAAIEQDPHATAVAEPIVEHLARLLIWLTVAYDPTLIALGGGVGTSTPALNKLIATRIASWNMTLPGLTSSGPAERLRSIDPAIPTGSLGAALLGQRQHGATNTTN